MNKAIICGRLGVDAEIINTKNGNIMVKLVVATRDRDETDWHQVKVVDNKLALTCRKCTKGQIVSISGKIKTKKRFDEKSQQNRYDTYIEAEEVIFLTGFNNDKNPNKKDDEHKN